MLPGGNYRAGGNDTNDTGTGTGDTGDDDSTTGTGSTTWWTGTTGTDSASQSNSDSAGESTQSASASDSGTTGSSTGDDPTSPSASDSDSHTTGSSSSSSSSSGGSEDAPFIIDVKTKQFIGPLAWGGIGGHPGTGWTPFDWAAWRAFALATDITYNENPTNGHFVSGEYRIWSDLMLSGTCLADGHIELSGLDYPLDAPGNADWEANVNAAGGEEALGIYGVVNPVQSKVQAQDDGEGYTSITITYVVSGRPNPAAEIPIQQLAFRFRRNIWHKIHVTLRCADGKLQVTHGGSRSSFPSVRTWVYSGGDEQINIVRTGVQGTLNRLWSLEPIPAP